MGAKKLHHLPHTKTSFVPTPESIRRPDSFRTTRVWDSEIFKFGLAGAVFGAIVFSLLGYFFVNTGMPVPGSLASAGGFVIISLASTGIILFALIGSLIALFHRA